MFKPVIALLALLITTCPSFGHQAEPDLQELIRRAALSVGEYQTKFKDLTAEEDQTIEEYDDQGKVEKRRRIESDLFIYQSQLDPTQMVEYRDVKSVDGKAIKKREARLVNLLDKSAKAESVKKELDRINRESQRYDLGFSFNGMTLYPGMLSGRTCAMLLGSRSLVASRWAAMMCLWLIISKYHRRHTSTLNSNCPSR